MNFIFIGSFDIFLNIDYKIISCHDDVLYIFAKHQFATVKSQFLFATNTFSYFGNFVSKENWMYETICMNTIRMKDSKNNIEIKTWFNVCKFLVFTEKSFFSINSIYKFIRTVNNYFSDCYFNNLFSILYFNLKVYRDIYSMFF